MAADKFMGITQEEFDKVVLKAVELTNLCMIHMEYHGKKYADCVPQQRVVVKVQ